MITEIRNQTRQEEGTKLLLRYVGRSNIKTMNSNWPECCPLPPQFCDATIAPLFLLYMSSILMKGKVILKQVPSWTHLSTICFFEPFPVLPLGHRYRKSFWHKQSLKACLDLTHPCSGRTRCFGNVDVTLDICCSHWWCTWNYNSQLKV